MSYKIHIKIDQLNGKKLNAIGMGREIEKRIEDMDFDDIVISNKINHSNAYEHPIYEKLKAHPSISDVRYGEISYPYGCGGAYGVGYTVYIKADAIPLITLSDGFGSDPVCVEINTDVWLEKIFGAETDPVQEAFYAYLEKHNLSEYEGISEFCAHMGWDVHGDNTYNCETDLSTGVQYHIAYKKGGDSIYDALFIFIERHNGGDIRGNYSNVEVYAIDDADSQLHAFLQPTVSWDLLSYRTADGEDIPHNRLYEYCEAYTAGYTSNPTYQLNEDIETAEIHPERLEVKITLKDGSEGVFEPHIEGIY